ncbi:DUF58 domain-containing protein [uncultured Acetobacteroides sp.]|uniref:DUF58 domain-containing protein n=1 Tax=uncultured Acetobacteroides sp. TaxID=1760811 RepID=UPI0029F4A964|nr:DUF58 domain-containing protein [uncultured Acetobacteroides sp.]
METSELLKKVRKIEIKTRGLTNQIFAGEYHSAFKGRGMAFSEVREYQYGDDIRNIDWNVSARFNEPYIKIFEEERELTVMLLIDVSGSSHFGTQKMFKNELIAEIAAVLSFSSIQNNDKVGVIFFSDKVEKFIPPKKGRSHILRIIREIIELQPESNKTNIAEALRYLTNAVKKRCTAFVLSDFNDFGESPSNVKFDEALRIAGNKHDLGAIMIYDPREVELPNVGLLEAVDAESGEVVWVDTSAASVRKTYSSWWNEAQRSLSTAFAKARVDWVSVSTNEDYVKPLIKLFKHR